MTCELQVLKHSGWYLRSSRPFQNHVIEKIRKKKRKKKRLRRKAKNVWNSGNYNIKKYTHITFGKYAEILLPFFIHLHLKHGEYKRKKKRKAIHNSSLIANRPPEHKIILSSLTVGSVVCSNRMWGKKSARFDVVKTWDEMLHLKLLWLIAYQVSL